jgi:hypothetical protein
VTKDLRDPLDSLELKVQKVYPVLQDPLVSLDLQDQLEIRAPRDPKDQLVRQEIVVFKDQQDQLELKVNKELQVPLDLQVTSDCREISEPLELQEQLATKGLQDFQGLPVHQETLDQLDHQDLLELKDFRVTQELLEIEVQLDQQEHLELKDQREHRAKLGQQGTEDKQVTQGNWVHRDRLDFRETKVRLGDLDRRETLAHQVPLAHRALPEPLASKVTQVQQVYLALQVNRVTSDHRVLPVHWA